MMACRRVEAQAAPITLGHYYVVIPSLKCLGASQLQASPYQLL